MYVIGVRDSWGCDAAEIVGQRKSDAFRSMRQSTHKNGPSNSNELLFCDRAAPLLTQRLTRQYEAKGFVQLACGMQSFESPKMNFSESTAFAKRHCLGHQVPSHAAASAPVIQDKPTQVCFVIP